jgi:RimJ/RimL family protein N-acetyltransferase
MELVSIYPSPQLSHLKLLYQILKERDETTSISHRSMPRWDQHVAFVLSKPYKNWWILEDSMEGAILSSPPEIIDVPFAVGAAYLSKQNEIGIFVMKKYQGKGYGREAVETIAATTHGPVLANINPRNKRSIKMFEELGFKHIQNTYRLG